MSKINCFHPQWTADCTEQMVSLVKQYADLGHPRGLQTQVPSSWYTHKCPQVWGVTSCLPRTWPSCSFVPHKTNAFPMSLLGPEGLWDSARLGYSIPEPTANFMTSLSRFSYRSGDGLQPSTKQNRFVFQGELWEFPWWCGSRWHAARGNWCQMLIQSDCGQ